MPNETQEVNEMSLEDLREYSKPVCWDCGLNYKASGFTVCKTCLYGSAVRATAKEIYARKRLLKLEAK